MKKLFLAILFLFAVILSAEACYPETTDRVVKVDGIYYAYNGNCGRRIGRWYVAGFEQDQDSVVLRNKVIIDGEEETIIDVYIIEYLHCRKYDDNGDPLSEIRWDAIHGKQRRILKTHIHNSVKRYIDQYSTWNKYAGRADVLYIHARIGGAVNWPYYYQEVVNEPWFLEKVDDAWDCSYCDIYALIKNE